MPVLQVDDRLTHVPARVLVAGTSGAGKTTTATRVAEILGIQHTEIDALFHGPDWTPRVTFEADVERYTSEQTWVTEWQYPSVRALLAERADTLIWLHFRRSTVMRQVVRRTLRRRLRRELLWNVNLEPPLRTFFTDRDHIIRWAWHTHHSVAQRVARVAEDHPGLQVVELRSHREVDRWLAGSLVASLRNAGS